MSSAARGPDAQISGTAESSSGKLELSVYQAKSFLFLLWPLWLPLVVMLGIAIAMSTLGLAIVNVVIIIVAVT